MAKAYVSKSIYILDGWKTNTLHYLMDRIYRPLSRSSIIDVADARDVLRAQLFCHFWPAESQYFTVNSVGVQPKASKSEDDHKKPLRTATNRNLGAGAFMKGEMLRGLDGRVFRQGTRVGPGRRRMIGGGRRHFGVISSNTSDVAFSSLVGETEEADMENQVEASTLRKVLAPIRVESRSTPEEESWYFSNTLDAGQADEMFNLFINVDECEDTI
jgi:hypothetical protein